MSDEPLVEQCVNCGRMFPANALDHDTLRCDECLNEYLSDPVLRGDEPLAMTLDSQLPDDARMNAYYYGFNRTGVGVIDAILSAVAWAGKGSHHTEDWNEDGGGYYEDRAGLPPAHTATELIQLTAARSADAIRAAHNDKAELVKALRGLYIVLRNRHHGRMPDEVRVAYEAAHAALAAVGEES